MIAMMKNEHQYAAGKRRWLELKWKLLGPEFTSADLEELRALERDLSAYDFLYNGNRKGKWFPTYTGKRFWPEDPRPEDICIVDIAHALARINRFNGHTRESYSVAQHCVYVARQLPAHLGLFGLLHDAGECYLGDVITPIKRLFRDFYEGLEEQVMWAVADVFQFSMTPPERLEVKKADMVLLMTEIRDLTPAALYNGEVRVAPLGAKIDWCWSAAMAEQTFLDCFVELNRANRAVRRKAA